MGISILKNIVFALFLSLIKIPLNIVGPELISRAWVTSDEWSGIISNLAILGACWVWAKIENTETMLKMSGVVPVEHSDRIARVALSANPDDPNVSLEKIKQTAEELKVLTK